MDREKRLLNTLLVISELTAAIALLSTGDILQPILFVFILGFIFFLSLGERLPRNRALTPIAVVFIALLSYAIKRSNDFQALEAGAQSVLLIHLSLFLLPNSKRIRYFRFGNTFVITSLAAGLSPEFETGALIVAYFWSAFLCLSAQYVFDFSRLTLSDLKRFGNFRIFTNLSVGILIFSALTAFVFPLLPRLNVSQMVTANTLGQLGFSGEVDLQSRGRDDGDSAIAVRIQIPDNPTLRERLFKEELLMVQPLDIFDGRGWYTLDSRGFEHYPLPNDPDLSESIVIIREALRVPLLPLFYGSRIVQAQWERHQLPAVLRTPRNTFKVHNSGRTRITYAVKFGSENNPSPESKLEPLPIHSDLPSKSVEIKNLISPIAAKIFRPGQDAHARINAIQNYFGRERFEYSLTPMEGRVTSSAERLHRFLVLDKAGHCELFATTAALLLRSSGIPARLAAGFRLSDYRGTNFMVLRNSDAHVWVEFWDQKKAQWTQFDPTPVINFPLWQRAYREALAYRDDLATLWYRFVVDADVIQLREIAIRSFRALSESRTLQALGFFIIAFFAIFFYRRQLAKIRLHYGILPAPALRRLRRQIDRHSKARLSDAQAKILAQALGIYLEIRFGPPKEASLQKESIEKARELIRDLKSA